MNFYKLQKLPLHLSLHYDIQYVCIYYLCDYIYVSELVVEVNVLVREREREREADDLLLVKVPRTISTKTQRWFAAMPFVSSPTISFVKIDLPRFFVSSLSSCASMLVVVVVIAITFFMYLQYRIASNMDRSYLINNVLNGERVNTILNKITVYVIKLHELFFSFFSVEIFNYDSFRGNFN